MSIQSSIATNIATTEYQKFVEIQNDANFPPVSVIRWEYPDAGINPVSSLNVFPKYAVLTYNVNTAQANASPFGDNSATDAFGRLRVSQPNSLLDSKLIYDKQNVIYDEVLSGTATSTFSAYDSCVVMRTVANNDLVIRQSKIRFNYQPGKSLMYVFTGNFKPEANIIKRVGAFQSLSSVPYDPSDGIWLEVTQSGPKFRIEKTQGTPHTNYAPQSAWNIDKLDGTGPSGYSLDFTKNQIFAIDYEWLSLGRVRFGFYVNGKLIYAHQDNHLNELTAPYMTYSNQPVRYEIRQVGEGNGIMKHICCSVMSEGGEDDVGTLVTAAVTGAGVGVSDTGFTPILAVRLNPANPNLVATLKQLDIVNNSSKNLIYQIFLNPTFSTPLTYQNLNNSQLQYALGSSSITITDPGHVLVTNYALASQRSGESSEQLAKTLGRIGALINGTTEQLVLAGKLVASGGSNNDVHACMNLLIRG